MVWAFLFKSHLCCTRLFLRARSALRGTTAFMFQSIKELARKNKNCCFPQQKKGKSKYDFRQKYHMSNSSGGKLSFHGQIVPINLTPKCYRCTKRRMTHRSSIYTDGISNSTLHSSLLICLLPCCTTLLLHSLYLEQEVDDFGEFRNITEATD